MSSDLHKLICPSGGIRAALTLALTLHGSPERNRLLMDVSIDSVNTLAAGSIFHHVGAEPEGSSVGATNLSPSGHKVPLSKELGPPPLG